MAGGKDGNPNVKVTAWAGYVTIGSDGRMYMTSNNISKGPSWLDTVTPGSMHYDPKTANYKWYNRWYYRMKFRQTYEAPPEPLGVGQFTYDGQGNRTPDARADGGLEPGETPV